MEQGKAASTGRPFAITVSMASLRRGQSGVPIFPDGFEAEAGDDVGDFAWGSFIGNFELAGGGGVGGPFAGAFGERDDAATFGQMQMFAASAGIAAGFGVAAGAEHGDAEGNQAVSQVGGFARGEDEPGIRQEDAEGTDELNEFAIGDGLRGIEFAGARSQAGKGKGELSFPAMAEEILGVGGEADGFMPPLGHAIKSADAEAPESRGVSALRGFETPIKIAFGPGGVHVLIDGAIVGFLINDEAFGAGLNQGTVAIGIHGADFERDARNFVLQRGDAIAEVIGGDEFRMFTSDEQEIAKALFLESAGFAQDFFDRKGDAQNGVVARKPAVTAVVNAFVGKIERGKEANDFSEARACQGGGALSQGVEAAGGGRGNQVGEIQQTGADRAQTAVDGGRGGIEGLLHEQPGIELVELCDKTHG
jgi:hypothetical protein